MLTTAETRRPTRRSLAAGVVVVAVLIGALMLLGSSQTARATSHDHAVLDWNRYALEALVTGADGVAGAGQPPPVSQLHLAMVQGAVYDAVNMIDGGHEPYIHGLPAGSGSKAAAAATAAHHVLVGMTITPALSAGMVTRLDNLLAASLAAATATDGAGSVAAGSAAGAAAAAAMLAARATDGRYGTFRFTCGDAPGEWRPVAETLTCPTGGPNDPNAWVARVTPFTLESTSQFRSKGPHALTSGAYAKEYNEVKELGAATGSSRTSEQNALAGFYTNNVSPVELFNRTMRTIAGNEGLGLAGQARLFAMLNMAGADALINCWDDKERWSFWRPVTAIRLGDNDGNPKTTGDPSWTPLSANPPYPDHPSGYNCATGAYMHTAAAFFGKKPLTFEVVRRVAGTTDVTRTYRQFTDVIDDTIDARMYQGIHFRTPDVQGAEIGKDVSRWVEQNFFGRAKK